MVNEVRFHFLSYCIWKVCLGPALGVELEGRIPLSCANRPRFFKFFLKPIFRGEITVPWRFKLGTFLSLSIKVIRNAVNMQVEEQRTQRTALF